MNMDCVLCLAIDDLSVAAAVLVDGYSLCRVHAGNYARWEWPIALDMNERLYMRATIRNARDHQEQAHA